MRAAYSLHNPFINRFNEPVTRRRDEMQCDEYMAWLRERNLGLSTRRTTVVRASAHLGRMIAGFCGLLVLLISIAAFVRAL